ncbi:hypothetical protein [Flavihumibacter fluvii]|uniref:hypothetical protein n=1 Tax=Flavihumibacter fluvii TaxID=2838157 RepID=UPI001BDF2DBD|nr:hypothetical protein [Flavihumibacter fluvii]ULQ53899.1 hypothetical protein KJS93_06140 [Flavihumibacter fluvii]
MLIGIFDTEHFETAYPLVKLFDLPGNSIIIFTNLPTALLLKEMLGNRSEHYSWIIQGADEHHVRFIYRIHNILQQREPDLFLYSTVSHNHLFHAVLLKLHPRMRSVLTLHAINSLFYFPLSLNPKEFFRSLGRKLLLKTVGELNVLSPNLKAPLQQKLPSPKKIHHIPGVVFEYKNKEQPVTHFIRLVVPGSIDGGRRDYLQVFELLNLAEKQKLPLEIVILGAPYREYGQGIIQKARAWHGVFCRIILITDGIIPALVFDAELNAAHFVFIPAVIESYAYNGIKEEYGLTKTSGSIFDTIKMAKPFLYPSALSIPADMASSGFGYKNLAEIISFLQAIFTDKRSYSAWNEKAFQNSLKYTIDQVRSENHSLLAGTHLYFLQLYSGRQYRHGGIGYSDIEAILLEEGYLPISLTEKYGWLSVMKRWIGVQQVIQRLPFESFVVCLLPVYPRMYKYLLKRLSMHGHRLIFMVTDIDGLKDGNNRVLVEELKLMQLANHFIVHSEAMEQWLKNRFPGAITSILGPFDFLAPPVNRQRFKSNLVCFAGNLEKSIFLNDLHKIGQVSFYLYGDGITDKIRQQVNCTWKGSYDPHTLPSVLEGSFGLVWEGDSIIGAEGSIGNYTKIIFHHKLSLYILAGIPVIAPVFSASAAYIRSHGIGWLINNLEELPGLIAGISETDYQAAIDSMQPIADELSKGQHFRKALREIIAIKTSS